MYLNREINIIISGWPSCGSTSTGLILSYILQTRYIDAGSVSKFIANQLGYTTKNKTQVEFETKYGLILDSLWESYIAWKLSNSTNLVVNGKITGFFAETKKNQFETYIICDSNIRSLRAKTENRLEKISKRDMTLQKRWFKLFGIDFFDLEQIRENYDFVIDNSNLSISETAFEIYTAMSNSMGVERKFLLSDFEKIEMILEARGKNFFREQLENNNLSVPNTEIFQDWQKKFYLDLEKLPVEIQEIVCMS